MHAHDSETTINIIIYTMFSYMKNVTIVVSQIDQYSSITAALNVASLKLYSSRMIITIKNQHFYSTFLTIVILLYNRVICMLIGDL